MKKKPFDIDKVFQQLRKAVEGFPKAAMFDLRDRGFGSPFEQLVGSLISARTRDETTLSACLRLFQRARTPVEMIEVGPQAIADQLHGVTFATAKARDIVEFSHEIVESPGGQVPDTMEGLTRFRGVGPKVAALTLAVGFGKEALAVDVHVHRIANRWDFIATRTPEQSAGALAQVLPRRYWIEINERLVPFGKHICTLIHPRCSQCLLLAMCMQVGVNADERA